MVTVPATDAWSLCHGDTKGPWYGCEQYPVFSKGKEEVVGHPAATTVSSVGLFHSTPCHFLSLLEIFDFFWCNGNPNKQHSSIASWERATLAFYFPHATSFFLNLKITFTLLETVGISGFMLFLRLTTTPETFAVILVLSQLVCTLYLYLWFFPTKCTLCIIFIRFHFLDLLFSKIPLNSELVLYHSYLVQAG